MATRIKSSQILDGAIVAADLHSAITVSTTSSGTFGSLVVDQAGTSDTALLSIISDHNDHSMLRFQKDTSGTVTDAWRLVREPTGELVLDQGSGNIDFTFSTAGDFSVHDGDVTIDSGNLVLTTGEIHGPSTLVIDPAGIGDNTGLVQIKGDLQVSGNTTTINSTTLDVTDLNITIASGAADQAAADGAGLTFEGANAKLTWNYDATLPGLNINKYLMIDPGNSATTPERPFHVKSAVNQLAIFESTDARASIEVRDVDDTAFLVTESSKFGIMSTAFIGNNGIVFDLTSFNVGISTDSPESLLHVVETPATGAPNVNAQLTVEDSTNAGIAIHSDDTGMGSVYFGSSTNNGIARIRYDHSTDTFTIRSDGYEMFQISPAVSQGQQIVIDNGDELGVGHMTLQSLTNHNTNDYVRSSILNTRDKDQISYSTSNEEWTHAGGASTDWSGLFHHNNYFGIYSGDGSTDGWTKTHSTFQTDHLAIRIDNEDSNARDIDLYGHVTINASNGTHEFVENGLLLNKNEAGAPGVGETRIYMGEDDDGTQARLIKDHTSAENYRFSLFAGRGSSSLADLRLLAGDTSKFVDFTGSDLSAYFYGNITSTGDINSLSDIKHKENIKPIENATETVSSLEGVEFDWKNGNGHSYGFIAQEVEKILPDLVTENNDSKHVNYLGVIGILVEAIKEQDARIRALENK